eukprot:COSAG05_NODE_15143_length_377_cov_0.910072_1_plen_78_part_10
MHPLVALAARRQYHTPFTLCATGTQQPHAFSPHVGAAVLRRIIRHTGRHVNSATRSRSVGTPNGERQSQPSAARSVQF